MLPPIEQNILSSAYENILNEIIDIDTYNEEFKNTIANCYYWKFFASKYGQKSFDFIFARGMNDFSSTYLSKYVINGALYAKELCATFDPMSKNDRDYFAQLFLDDVKYNIKDAIDKSLFTRTIQRRFAKPFPEHEGLWRLMQQTRNLPKSRK